MRNRFLLLSVFLGFVFPFNSAAGDVKTIKIGVVGPMKYYGGQEIWNGALMAATEINGKGGVRVGQKKMHLELIKADSNEFIGAQFAANAMEMLLFKYKVDFVVGGYRSEAVLSMQDVAMDYRKIYFSIGAALPELCQRVGRNYERYKYYFRGTPGSYYLAKGCFLQLNFIAQALRKKLGMQTIKVAIAAEKADWVEAMITASKKYFPAMDLELAGIFRVSSVATDASATIEAIAKTKAPIVFTLFSSNAGTSFVSQAAEIKLPAILAGINVDAQRNGFWNATKGKANYVITTAGYCEGVEISQLTKPFVKNYLQRFGEVPVVAAESYSSIIFILVPTIEQAGSLNPDLLVKILEKKEYSTPRGIWAFDKDKLGRPLHELKFGPEYALMLGVQWINGEMKGIWPNQYVEKPGAQPLTYKGIVDLKIPPLVLAAYKQKWFVAD